MWSIRWALIQYYYYLYRRKTMWRDKWRMAIEKPKIEAWPRAFLIVLIRNQPCRHLDFGLLVPWTMGQWISIVYATLFVVLCYSSPGKLIHYLKTFVVSRTMLSLLSTPAAPPKKSHILILETFEYVRLLGKLQRELNLQMEFTLLIRWLFNREVILDYPDSHNLI